MLAQITTSPSQDSLLYYIFHHKDEYKVNIKINVMYLVCHHWLPHEP